MERMMICKKCGIDGNFSWDRDWYDNTGKWRLMDNNLKRPHECTPKKKVEEIHSEEDRECNCDMCRLNKNRFGDASNYVAFNEPKLSPEQEKNKPKPTWQKPSRD